MTYSPVGKYEYLVLQVDSLDASLQDELNARGAEGWRLANCEIPGRSFICIFEREIAAPVVADPVAPEYVHPVKARKSRTVKAKE